jgi:hypothetical protein
MGPRCDLWFILTDAPALPLSFQAKAEMGSLASGSPEMRSVLQTCASCKLQSPGASGLGLGAWGLGLGLRASAVTGTGGAAAQTPPGNGAPRAFHILRGPSSSTRCRQVQGLDSQEWRQQTEAHRRGAREGTPFSSRSLDPATDPRLPAAALSDSIAPPALRMCFSLPHANTAPRCILCPRLSRRQSSRRAVLPQKVCGACYPRRCAGETAD